MFKNVLKKIAQFAYDHSDYVKKSVDNYRGIQAALARTEDFKITTDQIAEMVLDEAAKIQNRTPGFKAVIGTSAQLRERIPQKQEIMRKILMEKVGIFGNIEFVKKCVKQIADGGAQKFADSLMAEMMCSEIEEDEDCIDCVVFYPENIQCWWWQSAIRGESLKEIIQQAVKHEFRHAEQIATLRKIGGSDLVKKFWHVELRTPYAKRVMEKDAFAEQHLDHYRPIEEFVAEALAEVNAK